MSCLACFKQRRAEVSPAIESASVIRSNNDTSSVAQNKQNTTSDKVNSDSKSAAKTDSQKRANGLNNVPNLNKATVKVSQQPPAAILGDLAVVMDDYVQRSELEAEIQARIQQLCHSDKGILLIYGDGGVGKTTMLRSVLTSSFIGDCGFSTCIWLNVGQISKLFTQNQPNADESFFESLSGLVAAKRETDGESFRISVRRHFRNKIAGKVLLVLEDVSHKVIFSCAKTLGSNVRTVAISRRNFGNEIRQPSWFNEPAISIDEMPAKSISEFFQKCQAKIINVEKLVKSCNGRPLLADVISAKLSKKETAEQAQIFADKLLAKFAQLDEKKDNSSKKLALTVFEDESPDFRLWYYIFLIFDPGSYVELEDLAILLQADAEETAKCCQNFAELALVRHSQDNRLFNIHRNLYEAAVDYAVNEEDGDVGEDLKKFEADIMAGLGQLRRNFLKTSTYGDNCENVLHLPIIRRREKLTQAIVKEITQLKQGMLLFELCSQKSVKDHGSNTPLHLLLIDNDTECWLKDEGTPAEQNYGLATCCLLIDRLLSFDKSIARQRLAIKNDKGESVTDLLLKNTSKSGGLGWNRNAMLTAAAFGYREILSFLLEAGADKQCLDNEGNNLLLISVKYGQQAIVRELCQPASGMDLNAQNKQGRTALMLAAENGDEQFLKILLERKDVVDVNKQDQDGNTAIMLAAPHGKVEMANQLLQQANANANLRNKLDDSAVWLSLFNKRLQFAKLVFEKGGRLRGNEAAALLSRSRFRKEVEVEKLINEWPAANDPSSDYENLASTLFKLLKIERPSNDTQGFLESIFSNDRKKATDAIGRLGAGSDQLLHCALHLAAYLGHVDCIDFLVKEAKVDANIRTKDNVTPLMHAATNGHLDVVKLLIDNKADANVSDNDGWMPIIRASIQGHLEVVKTLISKSADANSKDNRGRTPLTCASENGYVDVVELLIANKADVNESDSEGVTALMCATRNGHVGVVKRLIDSKCDVNIRDIEDKTALMGAAAGGHAEVVKILLDNKAEINGKSNKGWTALTFASRSGHENVVKVLAERKADLQAKSSEGSTPLMLAAQNGHVAVVSALISSSSSDIVNSKDSKRSTALIKAASKGHVEVVKLLLDNRADVDATDSEGWTALMFACQSGHADVAKLLIAKKADVDAVDRKERTSLMKAAGKGHAEVVKLLLDNKADVEAKDNESGTALLKAAEVGHAEVVKVLVEYKADVNASDDDEWTSLHYAAHGGYVDVVKLLLEKGADIEAKNDNDETALDLAFEAGHTAVTEVIQAAQRG